MQPTPETTIIAAIISSSVLSAILTKAFDFYFNNLEYKREYFKKLLDKRLDAYEGVESIIAQLGQLSHLTDGRLAPIIFCLGKVYFDEFVLKIMICQKKGIWLSDNTTNLLMVLNVFCINKVHNAIDENDNYDGQLQLLGTKNRERVGEIRSRLSESLTIDLKSLHQVDKFLKNKSTSNIGFDLQKKPNELLKS